MWYVDNSINENQYICFKSEKRQKKKHNLDQGGIPFKGQAGQGHGQPAKQQLLLNLRRYENVVQKNENDFLSRIFLRAASAVQRSFLFRNWTSHTVHIKMYVGFT